MVCQLCCRPSAGVAGRPQWKWAWQSIQLLGGWGLARWIAAPKIPQGLRRAGQQFCFVFHREMLVCLHCSIASKVVLAVPGLASCLATSESCRSSHAWPPPRQNWPPHPTNPQPASWAYWPGATWQGLPSLSVARVGESRPEPPGQSWQCRQIGQKPRPSNPQQERFHKAESTGRPRRQAPAASPPNAPCWQIVIRLLPCRHVGVGAMPFARFEVQATNRRAALPLPRNRKTAAHRWAPVAHCLAHFENSLHPNRFPNSASRLWPGPNP